MSAETAFSKVTRAGRGHQNSKAVMLLVATMTYNGLCQFRPEMRKASARMGRGGAHWAGFGHVRIRRTIQPSRYSGRRGEDQFSALPRLGGRIRIGAERQEEGQSWGTTLRLEAC